MGHLISECHTAHLQSIVDQAHLHRGVGSLTIAFELEPEQQVGQNQIQDSTCCHRAPQNNILMAHVTFNCKPGVGNPALNGSRFRFWDDIIDAW